MSTTAVANDPIQVLKDHLSSQVTLPTRRGDFDMNDGPESGVLAPFPDLKTAVDWLDAMLGERWRKADQEALDCQKYHRRVARAAIAAGTGAILCAITQLAIKLTFVSWISVADTFEVVAIVAASLAIALGLWAKFDRRWLARRHLAERLRMIKFRALEQLCCFDAATWRQRFEQEIDSVADLEDAGTIKEKIESWATDELIGSEFRAPDPCTPDPNLLRALTAYYFFKRVKFQADYFDRRRRDFKRQTGHWMHLSLPFFLISVGFVIAHFAFDLLAGRYHESTARVFEGLAVWFVAMAAIIPILGLGVRAWFAAFELPRSAILFGAKHRALNQLTDQLEHDAGKAVPTLDHLAHAEHFLENEHREWLRLLSDTEWFV